MVALGAAEVTVIVVALGGLILALGWVGLLAYCVSKKAWGWFAAIVVLPCLLGGFLVGGGMLMARRRYEAQVMAQRTRALRAMERELLAHADALLRAAAETSAVEVVGVVERAGDGRGGDGARLEASARGTRDALEAWLARIEEAIAGQPRFAVADFTIGEDGQDDLPEAAPGEVVTGRITLRIDAR